MFFSLVLSACTLIQSTSSNTVSTKHKVEFSCKTNQPELLKSATLLPFEGSQVVTYEMLVEQQLFKHVDNVEVSVFDENNNSRYFKYTKEQLNSFTHVNLNNLPTVNDDTVEKSESKKYAEQSMLFFRLSINDAEFKPISMQHTFNFTNPCKSVKHDFQFAFLSPLILGAPVNGQSWNALNEGTSQSLSHRRSVFIDKSEQLYIPQHYAIDFSRSRIEWMYYPRIILAALFSNSLDKTYGAKVFAVADGEVVAVANNLPEKKPLRASSAASYSLKSLTGNYIVYKMDNGKFAVYGHLQPNSVKVEVGDRVIKGQPIALVGNSGNSVAPHLHFSVNETSDSLQSDGVPFIFESFTTENKVYSQQRQKSSSTVNFE